nr:reverse transcriptase domain-containing protein [Tanacetum cinerariifolium]
MCSHWQYKFPLPVKVVATARRLEMPLPEVCTAIEGKKKKLPNASQKDINICSTDHDSGCHQATKGVIGLIRCFERTESMFSHSNCTEDWKVKFSTDSEKIMEAFIKGLPRCIEGNVTASKPQTLEEAINIAQRLMDQVTKYTPVQVLSDHKQKFDELSTTTTTLIITTTTTKTTATMITANNKTKDKKLSGLMPPPQLRTVGILETVPCVRNAPCIT